MSVLHRTRRDHDLHEDRADDTEVVERPTETHHEPVANDRETRTTERIWAFAPGQLVSLIVGIFSVAVGVLAMVRAGIDGSLATPVVEVLGVSHTAWLGLAEVALGVLLILAGTGPWGRPLSVLLGAAMIIAGVLIGVEPGEMPSELGLEEDFGWALALLGALVALAAMVLPVWRSHRVKRDGVVVDDDRELVSH